MLQPSSRPLITFIFIIFCSWSTLDGVVSDPQTNLLNAGCTPSNLVALSNFSIFSENVNKTFQRIRKKLFNQSKLFATEETADAENPAFTLFQCRSYLSVHDCVACFDAAARQVRGCPAGAQGGRAVFDGCFLRYETSAFFGQTMENFNAVSCGNQSARESTPLFTSLVQRVLMNLQTSTPKKHGCFVAAKAQLLTNNNGTTTIYAFAQCIQTITQGGCYDCLKACYSNMQLCLPNSDGKAFAAGCFMRYTTSSFFPHNYQMIDLTPLEEQVFFFPGCFMRYSTSSFFPDNWAIAQILQLQASSSNKSNKGIIIGGVVAGVSLALIFVALFALSIRRRKNHKITIVLRGDITGASKLTGPVTFSYNVLKTATKNFSEANKIGEGGFGAVYKGTLWNGKVVAIKKLKLRHSNKIDEEFESEVKLISNVHHRNLVRLLGCCSKGHERILVYEYMKNNSLDKYLYGEKKGYLNWKQRYEVILGIAKGLTYLHEDFHVRIIHRDIKTNNILLDDDLQPKIADFGLARLIPDDKTHLSTRFAGTL